MKFIILLIFISSAIQAAPQGDSFTYQGSLNESGQPANGSYDFQVEFLDAANGGNVIDVSSFPAVSVNNGLFILNLDIGDMAFVGEEVWIELHVAVNGVLPLNVLSPRQLITNAPYAIQSKFVAPDGVDSMSIKDASIGSSDIASGAITSVKLGNNSITSEKIVNGTITDSDIDGNSVQRRIAGTCAAGSSIRSIASDGSVVCEADDSGSSGWGLTGNAGLNSSMNFIGTTDDQPVVIKANNKRVMEAYQSPSSPYVNLLIGSESNLLNEFTGSTLDGTIVLSGHDNVIETTFVSSQSQFSSILGGVSSKISDAGNAIIAGGASNKINQGYAGAIIGGQNNEVNNSFGFAAGYSSIVNHIGSWVWTDFSSQMANDGMETTADNQFLIRATGGVGIGTNAPKSPVHIIGQGTSNGSTASSNEVIMTIEPSNSTNNVAAVLNTLEDFKESALIFSNQGIAEFDIRADSGTIMGFNQYDDFGTKTTLLNLVNNGVTKRMDVNLNLEPFSHNTFDIGNSSFRWSTIYAVNPLDVSSDKRLKNNITDVKYGLSEILTLRPVSYNWKQGKDKGVHIGLIAQEVEKIIPEVVSQTDDEEAMRSMRYTELLPVVIKATQEQQVLIDQQRQEINELKSLVKELLGRIDN